MRRSPATASSCAIDVAHQLQRHALDVADAERHRAHVDVGQLAVEQVGEDLRLARAEHFFGDLAAGREAGARQRLLPAAARELELEVVLEVGEHDEPALGAGDLDRRIQHQREHVVQHAAAAQRAQAVEERRDLAQVADGGRRRLVLGRAGVGEQEDQLGAAGAPEADAVAVHQRAVSVIGSSLT